MKPPLYAVLAALAISSVAVHGTDATDTKAAVKALAGIPAAELPAAATKAVMQAPQAARVATTEAVIRRIARSNPSALRLVVSALAKENASLAAVAAGTAARANPESVALVAAAACSAAPEKSSEVITYCASRTALSRSSLSDVVASIEPTYAALRAEPGYAANALSVEGEAIDTTSSAAVIRGGTVIAPRPIPGQIGITMNGDAVTVAPTAIGPGRPGFDPDRYARGGN